VTLTDVASLAQVDRSVVSRVLSGDPRLNVREETRDRVRRAIEQLGYRPDPIARSLRTRRAEAFGLLIPDFSNPVYASIIKGAEAAAVRRGCVLMTGSLAGAGYEPRQYVDVLGRGRVDGVLLAGADATGELVDQLQRLEVPWLLLNRRLPGAHRHVTLDDERAATLAVGHLVELGHRRVAHLAGPPEADTAQRRRAGYERAVRAAGLQVRDDLLVATDYTSTGGAAGMAELMALDPPPTAVFVANVAAAVGALYAARRAGRSVPEDVSVVAVHDLPLAAYLEPPLTTVRMPVEELGARALELLATTPPESDIAEVIAGPMELVIRGSTAPLPA